MVDQLGNSIMEREVKHQIYYYLDGQDYYNAEGATLNGGATSVLDNEGYPLSEASKE